MRTLTIIIPYFKGGEFLLRCLDSITSSTIDKQLKINLLIIDNGVPIPQQSAVSDQFQIEIIHTKYKLGFGRAVNIGLHVARERKSDYILITNQDTVFDKNTILQLQKQSDLFPGSLVFPIVKDWDFSPAPAWYAEKYLSGLDMLDASQQTVELESQSAVCFWGNSEAIKIAGYFDPTYFMYHEDDDYFERFKKKEGVLVLVKSAIVGHYFERTSVEEGQRESHIWYRNARMRHFARYKSVPQFWMAWLRTSFGSVAKLRIRRLYHGLIHDIQILRNLDYVRHPDERSIEGAAKSQILEDMISK